MDWFLKHTDREWLLFLDDDIDVADEVEAVIEAEEDAVGAGFIGKHGAHAHGQDGAFGMACVKMSRSALEKIEPPWFAFTFTDDGLQMTRCECLYFCDKLKAVGIHPLKKGKVRHRIWTWAEPGDDVTEVKLKWGKKDGKVQTRTGSAAGPTAAASSSG